MDTNSKPTHTGADSARAIENPTILIVEDSPVQAELLRRALEGAGYKVAAASNGAEGLALAKANHPAAVVSDINMPVMDGYAMCQALRRDESLKSTPVILLTMLSDPHDVIHGLNAGADAYVTKPYNVPALISRLQLLLAYPPPPSPSMERRRVEVRLATETHLVDAHSPRMLNLLLSTYENAVLQNHELIATQQALEDLNQHLEQKVEEKTAELQASERRFRALIENATDLVLVIDTHGKITYVSPSTKRIGGYEPAELLGKGITEFIHPEDAPTAIVDLSALVHSPGALHVAELRYRTNESEWITIETVAKSAIDDPAIAGVVVNARDITERKRTEIKIAKLNRLYATLSGINMAIVHSTSPAQLFERTCEVAIEQGRFCVAWIGTIDRSSQLVTPIAQRGLAENALAIISDSIGQITEGRGNTATSIRESRLLYDNDYEIRNCSSAWRAAASHLGIRGSATLPIQQRGEVVAVLKLYVSEPNFFDSDQLALLEEMRSDISFAMDRFDIEAQKVQAEAALRESEERFRSINAAAQDAVMMIDDEGRLVSWNPAAERILGYRADEVLGREMHRLIAPARHQPAYATGLAAFQHSGKGAVIGKTIEIEAVRKDGREIPVELSVAALKLKDRWHAVGILRDITARRLAETEVRRLDWALRALGQSNSALVHAGSEKELFQSCCDAIAGGEGYPLAWIGLAQNDEARSVEIAAAAGGAIEFLQGFAVSWADDARGQGPAGTSIRTGVTQVTNNLAKTAACEPWIDRARAHGLESAISLPIRANSRALGTLVVYGREPDVFGQPEVDLFEELATDIGYGVSSRRTLRERDQLQQEQSLGVERLKNALIGTIGAVALTVEKRDPYTAGHQQRVAELCVAIGRKLDFAEDRLVGLRLGATIHDIGKIWVPAEILSRPGKLSMPELEFIKSHPQVGYDIVKDVQFPWPVTLMILQHHERLDGSGYPQGLKGDAIILEARILAVADVVEAMSSHRPYRPGLGLDAALAQIRQDAGSVLDAQVVDACERIFRDEGFSFSKA